MNTSVQEYFRELASDVLGIDVRQTRAGATGEERDQILLTIFVERIVPAAELERLGAVLGTSCVAPSYTLGLYTSISATIDLL